MNDTISRIGAEFATLQSGLEGLLARLQTLNRRVVEANRSLDDTTAVLDTLAPPAPDAGPATVEVPVILDVGEDTSTAAIVTEGGASERTEGGQGEGRTIAPEGTTVPSSNINGRARKSSVPTTWEGIRGLKGAALDRALDELGLQPKRGAGSAMQNYKRIWQRVQNRELGG